MEGKDEIKEENGRNERKTERTDEEKKDRERGKEIRRRGEKKSRQRKNERSKGIEMRIWRMVKKAGINYAKSYNLKFHFLSAHTYTR
jgi:hypothetical protein